mmetsp:Transcript_13360/g.22260  ORF Transcript_13360/g.22260 Transcript_13360/m.22260 type:complete len:242 (-) Transcript_13360:424-1149(-)
MRVMERFSIGRSSRMWKFGLMFYEDTISPLSKRDSKEMRKCITEELNEISIKDRRFASQEWELRQVGGARRGKEGGHDADFMITHPRIGIQGEGQGVLEAVIDGLVSKKFLLPRTHPHSFFMLRKGRIFSRSGSYSSSTHIVKLKRSVHVAAHGYDNLAQDSFDRIFGVFRTTEGKMRRIDIIVVPYIEKAFALLGWTGSSLLNRNMRQYCRERGLFLCNHCLLTIEPEPKLGDSFGGVGI